MRATFEEKTYENYFNAELDRVSSIFFPLGQVQEGNLGFDSSAFSKNRHLWRYTGFPFWFFPPFHGISLREIADEMEHFLNISINDIPNMKANLLFQYKKPEYITLSSGTEWRHWNEPYFRYNIYGEQQNLLMQINNKFNSKILILYAAPAVQNINDLVNLKIERKIIANSNFKKCCELNGHHRNTYTKAGTHSIACSQPNRIENLNFLEELSKLNNDNQTYKSNRQFIINFTKDILQLGNENFYFGNSLKKLNGEIEKIERYELFYSFLAMSNFKFLTGIQWLVKI